MKTSPGFMVLTILGLSAFYKGTSPAPVPTPPAPVPTPTTRFNASGNNRFIFWTPWGIPYPGLQGSNLFLGVVRSINTQMNAYITDVYSYPGMIFLNKEVFLPITQVDLYAKSP